MLYSQLIMNKNTDLKTLFSNIIVHVGEDVERDGLKKTPERAAKAFEKLTEGYQIDLDELVNNAIFDSDNDEMVIVKDIEFYSLCEHHLLPFLGKCHIAYLPQGKVIGLSKVARLVDAFASRLQIQENLTQQIAAAIKHYTQARGVGVMIDAAHLCMMMRGVQKQDSTTITFSMLDEFKTDTRLQDKFINAITPHPR